MGHGPASLNITDRRLPDFARRERAIGEILTLLTGSNTTEA